MPLEDYSPPAIQSHKGLQILIIERQSPNVLVKLDGMPQSARLVPGCGKLFMDACRAVGIAARFVSGYQRGGNGQEKRYMHT